MKTQQEQTNFYLKVVAAFSPSDLRAVLALEKKCFPESWQYSDAEEHFSKLLSEPNNINIFLCTNNDEYVGYLVVRPHNEVVNEIADFDTNFLKKEPNSWYYLESIEIDPDYQGMGGSKILIEGAVAEIIKKGGVGLTVHARTTNGFNQNIKKVLKDKHTLSRNIDSWHFGDNEPYEYIEFKLE